MELSLDTMVQMLARSGLIDNATALTALTRELKCDSASEFTSYLVSKQAITKWQAEQLHQGRYKGYFLDHFKLVDLLSGGTRDFARYLAEDQRTGKQVVLRITRPQRELGGTKHQYTVEESEP
jgi:hypothetical protein